MNPKSGVHFWVRGSKAPNAKVGTGFAWKDAMERKFKAPNVKPISHPGL